MEISLCHCFARKLCNLLVGSIALGTARHSCGHCQRARPPMEILRQQEHGWHSSVLRNTLLHVSIRSQKELTGNRSFVLLGGPVIVPIFQIPQRFQLVNGLSGLDAGVRLIPFTMCMPVGTVISAILTTRLHVAPIWVIMGGACLQTLGFALLGTLPVSLDIPSRTYGFEMLSGIGCGINYTLVFLLIPYCLQVRDHGEFNQSSFESCERTRKRNIY